METTFRVQWVRKFRSLAIGVALLSALAAVLLCSVRVVRLGWTAAFEHISPSAFVLLVLLGIPVVSVIGTLPIAASLKRSSVTVTETEVRGRDAWGRRVSIPLADISGFDRSGHRGVNAIVVLSRTHGSLYIDEHTERVDELVAMLSRHVVDDGEGA